MVYYVTNGIPIVSNAVYRKGVYNSTYNNNHSAGSGGGAGGEVKYIPSLSYAVTPGSTYSIYVGAGGMGGSAASGIETEGLSGEVSYFDTIIALGGSGGSQSRKSANTTNGYKTGGGGGEFSGNIIGGLGGAGVGAAALYANNTSLLAGTTGGVGATYNFDGTGNKSFGAGGDGGDPNVAGVVGTVAGLGKGAQGVGAEANSFTSGVAGGSGVVMLKYYY